jgi:hypothetical protein
MNKIKFLLIFILILSLVQVNVAEKRRPKRPMSHFTDPGSPSYVPYPFPKNNSELIADLKYVIQLHYLPTEGRNSISLGEQHPSFTILPSLLEENSVYRIGKIYKVRNLLPGMAHDYTWLIIILDKNDTVACRVIMEANGLWLGTQSYPKDWKPVKLVTEEEVVTGLGKVTGQPVNRKDLKRMELIALPPHLGNDFVPAYEMIHKNGKAYYFDTGERKYYRIKKEKPWKKDKNGIRPGFKDIIKSKERFAYDEINDKIYFFEKLNKKE